MNIMKKYPFVILIILMLFFFTKSAVSQTYTAGDQINLQINEFSLIDTNHAPVTLALTTSVAGAPVTTTSNSDMYVKISSVVPGGTDREMTVRIASGTVPTGTKLTVVSASCTTANSGGNRGTAITTPIILSATDQFLVRFIGSCYTGTGYNDGYRLTYTWQTDNPATNYGLLKSTTNPTPITVVLTLTAHDGN